MDAWECSECKASNLLANAPDRCPICGHNRCSNCRIGPPPAYLGPSDMFPTRARPSYTTQSAPYSANYHSAHPLSSSTYTNPSTAPRHPFLPTGTARAPPPRFTRHAASSSAYTRYPTTQRSPMHNPPSMSGWWRCCQDGYDNNPAHNPDRCFNDGHVKCPACLEL